MSSGIAPIDRTTRPPMMPSEANDYFTELKDKSAPPPLDGPTVAAALIPLPASRRGRHGGGSSRGVGRRRGRKRQRLKTISNLKTENQLRTEHSRKSKGKATKMRNLTTIYLNPQSIMHICLLLLMLMTPWTVGNQEKKRKQHYELNRYSQHPTFLQSSQHSRKS